MRFITTINNKKCLEWEISGTQGALMALLYEANAWAKEIIIDNKVYYFVSKNLILRELPLYYEKVDTVYRHLKVLAQKGIIEYIKQDKKDLIRLTEKGKTWNYQKTEKEVENSDFNPNKNINSDTNPNELGFQSEKEAKNSDFNPNKNINSDTNPNELGFQSEKEAKNSDFNPTNKDTNIQKDINNNIIYLFKSSEFKEKFDYFVQQRKLERKKEGNDLGILEIDLYQKRLYELSKGDEKEALKILEKAIMRNWKDFYIEEGKNGNSNNTKYGRKQEDRHSKKPDYTKGFDDWN